MTKRIYGRRPLEALSDQRGSAGIWLIFCIFAMLIIIMMLLEYIRWINVRESIISDLDRTMSIAVEESMMDAYRSDYDGWLDPQVTEQSFYRELHDSMQLNSRYQRLKTDGKLLYTLRMISFRILEDSARIEVEAEADIPTFWEMSITVPIELITKNRRLE